MSNLIDMDWRPIYLLTSAIWTLLVMGCLGFALWRALSRPEASPFWHISATVTVVGAALVAIFATRLTVVTWALYLSYVVLAFGVLSILCGMCFIAWHRMSMYRDHYYR